MTWCCGRMKREVSTRCRRHRDRAACADALVAYWAKYDEYGLLVHDGGSSMVPIAYCPWCGTRLPASKRDRWFDALKAMGLEPGDQRIPAAYRSGAWWRREPSGAARGRRARRTSGGVSRRRRAIVV
jgi:hypothetical protein